MYPFTDILTYAANKCKDKEDALLLEIQADILFILSVVCENDLQRKVCIFLPYSVQKMSKHTIFSFNRHCFFCFNSKAGVSCSSLLTSHVS